MNAPISEAKSKKPRSSIPASTDVQHLAAKPQSPAKTKRPPPLIEIACPNAVNGAVEKPRALPRVAFSVAEVAAMTGLAPISIYRLIARGRLRACTVLRHKLISATEVAKLVNS